jgi:hypothetical protein
MLRSVFGFQLVDELKTEDWDWELCLSLSEDCEFAIDMANPIV